MNTLSKYKIESVIALMSQRAFDEQPLNIEELLHRNCCNSVYRVALPHRTVILKIAPEDGASSLHDEMHEMREEAAVIEKISQSRFIHVPHVLFYDRSHNLIESEYMFMENMPGVPFGSVCDCLSCEEQSELYTQAGIYARKIHAISSDFYGSLSDTKYRYTYWSRCFYCLTDDLLCRAEELRLELPIAPDRIRRRVKNEAPLLNNVKKPVLTHGNLHISNFLVDIKNTDITGIIGFKRAFYGDPLLDLPRAALDDNESFVCSFLSGGSFTIEQQLRLAIYRVYTGLCMMVECASCHTDTGMKETAQVCIARGLREYKEFRGEPF